MLYGKHRTYLAGVTGEKSGKAVHSLLFSQSKSPSAQGAVLLRQPEMVVGNGGGARDVVVSRGQDEVCQLEQSFMRYASR